MHANALKLFSMYAGAYFKPGLDVLEISPGESPSALYQPGTSWSTAGITSDAYLTHHCQEYEFPVVDNRYDIVLSANVMEHVRMPWVWLKELVRVCKPGGVVITIAPANWPYHKDPIDCWRVYPDGMQAIYTYAGLEVEVCCALSSRPWHEKERAYFPWWRKIVDTIGIGRKP